MVFKMRAIVLQMRKPPSGLKGMLMVYVSKMSGPSTLLYSKKDIYLCPPEQSDQLTRDEAGNEQAAASKTVALSMRHPQPIRNRA
jgi:hypothetical protein